MKREIKFRGKEIGNGKWVRGDLRQVEGRCFIMDYDIGDDGITDHQKVFNIHYEVDPETVGQYTGLPDEEGTEICEKDRFQHEDDIGTVVYRNGMYCVEWDTPHTWGKDTSLWILHSSGRVIRDNPDLLEGGYE